MNDKSIRTRYPGERRSLIFSVVIILIISLALLQFSPWFLLFLVFIQLCYVVIKQRQLVGNSLTVSNTQFQDINDIVTDNSATLGIKKPDVYITQDPYLNAYTIGFKAPYSIVLTSSLVESLTRDELDFIIGHEIGHIKYGHATMLSLISPLGSGIPVMSFIYGDWQRRSEYTADRSGLISTPKIKSAISALIKLAVGEKLSKLVDIDTVTKQAYSSNSTLTSNISELFLTHPFITNRITELVDFESQVTTNQGTKLLYQQTEAI